MDSHLKTYAGFWQRVRAFTLDYFLILLYLTIVTLLFLLINAVFNIDQWLFTDRVWAQIFAFLIVTFPVTLYFAIRESSIKQATWGKQRLALKVMDRNGNRIGFRRAFARTILKFIPWETSHTLLWEIYFSQEPNSIFINYGYALVYLLIGLNIASLLITRTNQTLYDLLTSTYITKKALTQNPC